MAEVGRVCRVDRVGKVCRVGGVGGVGVGGVSLVGRVAGEGLVTCKRCASGMDNSMHHSMEVGSKRERTSAMLALACKPAGEPKLGDS